MGIPVQDNEGQREHGRPEEDLSTALNLPGKPYALYRQLALLGYYDSPGEAFAAGIAEFPDGAFSIQEVRSGSLGSLPPSLS